MDIPELKLPDDVQAGLDQLNELFNSNIVLGTLDDFLKEAAEAPLAARFSNGRPIGQGLDLPPGTNRSLMGLSEEAYKRAQLKLSIGRLRSKFMSLLCDAQSVYLDLKASQREFEPLEPAE